MNTVQQCSYLQDKFWGKITQFLHWLPVFPLHSHKTKPLKVTC